MKKFPEMYLDCKVSRAACMVAVLGGVFKGFYPHHMLTIDVTIDVQTNLVYYTFFVFPVRKKKNIPMSVLLRELKLLTFAFLEFSIYFS